MQRGQEELVGGCWLPPGMEGQRQRAEALSCLVGTCIALPGAWSRGEPAPGLVPLGASWGEQGEERRIWELEHLLGEAAGKGIVKLGISLQSTPFRQQEWMERGWNSTSELTSSPPMW